MALSREEELEHQLEIVTRRLDEAEKERKRVEKELEQKVIETHLREAIATAPVKVAPSAMLDVLKRAVAGGEWKVDSQGRLLRLAADGLPDVDVRGEYVGPANWLRSLQTEAPHLFVSEDAEAGAVKNPWARETFSLTEQGKLIQSNPSLAQRLASAAGVKLEV
jgi:hypothetical protein